MRRRNRGLTLLEMLVASTVLAVFSMFTMRLLGEARALRGAARERANLALIAQEQLDAARLAPALAVGETAVADPRWPAGTSVRVAVAKHAEGFLQIDVVAERKTDDGLPQVRLSALREEAGP